MFLWMKIFKWILKYLEKLDLERHVSDYKKKGAVCAEGQSANRSTSGPSVHSPGPGKTSSWQLPRICFDLPRQWQPGING